MTVHHGLRAAAGNTGSGGAIYGNPKLTYDWNYQVNAYWTGGSWQLYTHSGTPVTGNGSTGWTNEGFISPTPNQLGHGTSWRTTDYADLSAYSGKWAMFMYAFNQPSYWRADILFDNIKYEDDGGTLSIPGNANTTSAWQDYWVGYLGAANNLAGSSTWPLDSANQSNRYTLGTSTTAYGQWILHNSSTPSSSTGSVGTSNGYFVYYESSSNGNSPNHGYYNSTVQNSRRILLSKHAYLIGSSSTTPILYTP